GVPAELFVLPPALGQAKLFDGQTQLVVSESEKAILEDMGVESIKNKIANSSVAVMKLLEI
ncbi:hypothetical protein A2U01_0119553, partial [Trifolium medium]|nr:hypothetical protein [Trifolium medium]